MRRRMTSRADKRISVCVMMMTDALGGDISTFQYKRKADEGKKKGAGKFH